MSDQFADHLQRIFIDPDVGTRIYNTAQNMRQVDARLRVDESFATTRRLFAQTWDDYDGFMAEIDALTPGTTMAETRAIRGAVYAKLSANWQQYAIALKESFKDTAAAIESAAASLTPKQFKTYVRKFEDDREEMRFTRLTMDPYK